MGAVQDWARRTLPAPPSGHPGPECQWCPLCQFASVLRGEHPELAERVAEAGTALVDALRALAETAAAHAPTGEPDAAPAAAARPARGCSTSGSRTPARRPATPAPTPARDVPDDLPRRPRRPRVSALAIGVDIGGTKVAAGVVDEHGRGHRPRAARHARQRRPGHRERDRRGRRGARRPARGRGRRASGPRAGSATTTPPCCSRRTWPGAASRCKDALAGRIDLPLIVENDANAAAWAEYRFGAAREEPVVVCVTLGTGIGGGLVAGGNVYRGGYGLACEYGHMTLVPDGRRCACGNQGCWEMYASGRALARDARELAAESPVAAAALLELAGSPEGLTGPVVTAAAAAGDPAAQSICTTMGRWLGRGLANLAAIIDPSMFVIGGGVSAAGELLLRPAREEFAHTLTGRGFRPEAKVVLVELGPDAGLIGAADLARRLTRPAGLTEPVAHLARRLTRPMGQDGPPCACCPSMPARRAVTAARSRALIESAEVDVACVHNGPHLLRWRSISASIGRRSGLVAVGGGRPAGANLLLSTSASTRARPATCGWAAAPGGRPARRIAVAAARRSGVRRGRGHARRQRRRARGAGRRAARRDRSPHPGTPPTIVCVLGADPPRHGGVGGPGQGHDAGRRADLRRPAHHRRRDARARRSRRRRRRAGDPRGRAADAARSDGAAVDQTALPLRIRRRCRRRPRRRGARAPG